MHGSQIMGREKKGSMGDFWKKNKKKSSSCHLTSTFVWLKCFILDCQFPFHLRKQELPQLDTGSGTT